MEEAKKVQAMEDIKDDMTLWDKEDDRYLRTLISIHGNHDWKKISSGMNFTFPAKHRTSQECEERWYNHLDPAISKQPWTDQEELEMLIAHQKCQNKWSDVAMALNGRSNNTIKNRFYSIFRKVKNKIKRKEYTYSSKLELLEIFYMISLMEHYLMHPQPLNNDQKGKRGKDFIYSLLKNLRAEDVSRYKNEIQKMGGKETTLEELWLEQANESSPQKNDGQRLTPIDDKTAEIFKFISEPPIPGKARCVLPQPRVCDHPGALTPDEKDFIHVQAFQNKEPCSAGIGFCQPMAMSPPIFRAPFSAGRPRFAATAPQYEAFSDFTDIAVNIGTQAQYARSNIMPSGNSAFPSSEMNRIQFFQTPAQTQNQLQTSFVPIQFFRPRPY